MKIPENRCVNIDWLEVYCLEDRTNYPCNAEYYRRQGYIVNERDYGTRQYNEMFTIEDGHGRPWIEVRRNPASGASEFAGFVPESSHLRLTNNACYDDNAVAKFRDFLARHNYIFKRIFRIDVCYDFEFFDTGDRPEKFIQRYLAGKFAKINQCRCAAYGADNWASFDWETVSWGSPTSMVGTKIYCKTIELQHLKNDKPWIKYSWFVNKLIDDPINMTKVNSGGVRYKPAIWRIEFSLKSSADNWIVIEDQSGKREKKKAIPHRLSMFDSRDKLWERFQDLAFHYFRFKHYEKGKRKDRCKDKILFVWDQGKEFLKVGPLPAPSKPDRKEMLLKRRLAMYKATNSDTKVRSACDEIIHYIDKWEAKRIAPADNLLDARALQEAIAARLAGDQRSALEIIAEIKKLLSEEAIF